MGAEEVGSLPSGKIPRPLSVDPCSPVPVDVPVAFATEPVAFREVNQLPVVKSQFIPISCIVAIKAPSHRLGMMELNIGMFIFQLPFLPVYLHRGMTAATGKHALCYWGRGDGKFLACTTDKGDKTKP